jgi:hypothetical protein
MDDIKEIYAKIGFTNWILIHKDGIFIQEKFNIVFCKNGITLSNIFRYIYARTNGIKGKLNPRIKIIFKDGKITKTNNSNYLY